MVVFVPFRCFVFSSFRLALFRLFVISLGVFSWRFFVFSLGVMAGQKDEITPGEKTNYEKTPGEKTKNKSLKWRYFAWRFFVFSRSFFVISHGAFRYFVFLPGVISSFRYFAWRFFVISYFRLALFRLSAAP